MSHGGSRRRRYSRVRPDRRGRAPPRSRGRSGGWRSRCDGTNAILSARAGPKAGRDRGDDSHAESCQSSFSAYMQKHLTSPGCLSISCRVTVAARSARGDRFARARSRIRPASHACTAERVNSGKRGGCSGVLSKAFGVRIGRRRAGAAFDGTSGGRKTIAALCPRGFARVYTRGALRPRTQVDRSTIN